jgi:hypothetical protein
MRESPVWKQEAAEPNPLFFSGDFSRIHSMHTTRLQDNARTGGRPQW